MGNYFTKLEQIGEYFFISLLLGISVTLIIQSWRKNLSYLIASVAFGTFLGYGVMSISVGDWASFSILATVFGTVTGPATIALLQRKTLVDIAEDLKNVARNVKPR